MNDDTSPPAAAEHEVHHDPMAADRRTMKIAAAAMVVLVGVGVASAALFTRSACGDVQPGQREAPAAGTNVADVVAQAFPDLDEAARDAVFDGVSALAEVLGPVTGITDVGHADRLTDVGSDTAAFGPDSTVLASQGADVRAAAAFGPPSVVVGDGATVFAVALTNALTGQVDAIQPLDADLAAVGHCLDAATVNVPFAFLLDAGDGELLLFRTDEDAGDPELELRGPDGAVWASPLEVAVAPPGLLGERFSGYLGAELVVAARRVASGETAAAVTAVDRRDGERRWAVAPDDLPGSDDAPIWVEVVGASEDTVVLAVSPDDDRDLRLLVGLDAADGAVRWSDPEPVRIVDVAIADEATELVHDGSGLVVRSLDLGTGEREVHATVVAEQGSSVELPGDGALSVVGDAGVVIRTRAGVSIIDGGLPATDATVSADGAVTILFAAGQDAMAVTFGA